MRPERVVPAVVEFVDIAGLVKGASQGEGLGNQFLANIRETDAVVHVVRAFDDDDVLHVMGAVDPVRDREVIEFELALADLSHRREATRPGASRGEDRRQGGARRAGRARGRARGAERRTRALARATVAEEHRRTLAPLSLLTLKPVLYAANVTDAELSGAEHEGAHIAQLRARRRRQRRARRRSFPSPPRSRPSWPICPRRIARRFSSRSAWSRPGSIA